MEIHAPHQPILSVKEALVHLTIVTVGILIALSLEGHGILITPYPVIRFLGVETARIGNPLMSAAFTLKVRL